jgi:hypothetical protein
MARTHSPPTNQVSMGAVRFTFACIDIPNSVWIFSGSGAPVNGANGDGGGWAGIGSLFIRTDNGGLYSNTGTRASPTWTAR